MYMVGQKKVSLSIAAITLTILHSVITFLRVNVVFDFEIWHFFYFSMPDGRTGLVDRSSTPSPNFTLPRKNYMYCK